MLFNIVITYYYYHIDSQLNDSIGSRLVVKIN